jgi:hypothetical protein
MGGACHARGGPPRQRRMARDRLIWMVAMRRHCELAGSFASSSFKQLPNPLAEMICNRAQDRMHYLIVLVIAVFMAMYLGLGFMRLT